MTEARLRLFAAILCELAYDQDPPSGYFDHSLDTVLANRGMTPAELDELAKECGFDWRCQDEPDDPSTLCVACGRGLTASSSAGLCCCTEGAKKDRGAELRYKRTIGECYEPGCHARAEVDGWCDDHSEQLKQYGTHHPVGTTGATGG